MRVTRFQYPMEKSLIAKLDLMIARCIQKNPKRDAVLLNEGAEGEGKTSLSVAEGYYIAEQTGRVFDHTRVFHDLVKMINFLQTTEGEIAVWDEPSLQALSGDALTSLVKNMKRLLMMCRNKRHFIIINMTYFTEFGGYIVWQRPLGMVHVYSRNELEPGRFIYIKKRNLEHLWNDWRSKRRREYKKHAARYIRGKFPDVLNPDYKYNVLSEFDFNAYEKSKNDAIASIGKDAPSKRTEKQITREYKAKVIERALKLDLKIPTRTFCSMFDVTMRDIQRIKRDALRNEAKNKHITNSWVKEDDDGGHPEQLNEENVDTQ